MVSVYDAIEGLVRFIEGTQKYDPASAFAQKLNSLFVDLGAGWQLKAGEGIVLREDAQFEDAVQQSMAGLVSSGFTVAEKELREALNDISRRPEPDLTGAVHRALGALEAAARHVHGSEKGFGEIVRQIGIPKPLDTALEKMWVTRQTSDGMSARPTSPV